jgi:hypothetical protein
MAKSARKQTIRKKKRASKTACYAARSVAASQLRRRRHVLARRYGIPEELLGGSLNQVTRKCGKPMCRCASGDGHPMWTLTYSIDGRRHVEFLPDAAVARVKPLAIDGRAYRDALHEILAINAQLVSLWRNEQRARPSRQSSRKR